MPPERADVTVGVVGLGYVGLPLAAEFARQYPTIAFDIDERRVGELRAGHDRTLEIEAAELQPLVAGNLELTADPEVLGKANVYIVTVPTPVDRHNRPDLTPAGICFGDGGARAQVG